MKSLVLACVLSALSAQAAWADLAQGTVLVAEGHSVPACRRVFLKRTDGVTVVFRIPANSGGDGILSVALTALSTGRVVDIGYTAGQTTGCGTEASIDYISIHASN